VTDRDVASGYPPNTQLIFLILEQALFRQIKMEYVSLTFAPFVSFATNPDKITKK
jgi:hypothetical protein